LEAPGNDDNTPSQRENASPISTNNTTHPNTNDDTLNTPNSLDPNTNINNTNTNDNDTNHNTIQNQAAAPMQEDPSTNNPPIIVDVDVKTLQKHYHPQQFV